MRRLAIAAALILAGLTGLAAAQDGTPSGDAEALTAAKRQSAEAQQRADALERQAAQASTAAERARAQSDALAARIEAAESDLTAAEARLRVVGELQRQQRAQLAERQAPLMRLTGALQTMARRPPALALIQPGSLDDVVRVRALLASTLPTIRARTAGLRAEVARGEALRRDADTAVGALTASRERLRQRRVALARFEEAQRSRSQTLLESAATQSERATAFGEQAREIAALEDSRQYQAQMRAILAALPPPAPRPVNPPQPELERRPYTLPVDGRLVTGTGELSDAGVHARGLTFEVEGAGTVAAPAPGRVVYAGRFRSYGVVVVIDHGGGWLSAITNLGELAVREGDRVGRGDTLGRTGAGTSRVGVELRRNGVPVSITALIG